MLRDKTGKFVKGNKGFWLGKKRPSMSGERNWRWKGGTKYKNCFICQTPFEVRGKRIITGRFCSQRCAAKWKFTGSKNVNWKGGIPREKRTELPQYEEWRKTVYRKDRWQCQICEYKGRSLVAHHIKSYKHFPELRFEVNNGITLCRSCHCKLHTIHKKVIDFTEILNDYTLDSKRR